MKAGMQFGGNKCVDQRGVFLCEPITYSRSFNVLTDKQLSLRHTYATNGDGTVQKGSAFKANQAYICQLRAKPAHAHALPWMFNVSYRGPVAGIETPTRPCIPGAHILPFTDTGASPALTCLAPVAPNVRRTHSLRPLTYASSL